VERTAGKRALEAKTEVIPRGRRMRDKGKLTLGRPNPEDD